MANNPKVRSILRERFGIDIPEDTVFLPGLHNTTTDDVHIYDTEERYAELFNEKGKHGYAVIKNIEKNAYDWSQVRPEWGLSGNFAMVIGRRSLTKNANLRGKVFLHSYDYRLDRKGFILENILSGPDRKGFIITMWWAG